MMCWEESGKPQCFSPIILCPGYRESHAQLSTGKEVMAVAV